MHRRSTDRWHQFVVRIITHEDGLIEKIEDIRNKDVALTTFQDLCEKYPDQETYRVECNYHEMLGQKTSFHYEVALRKKEKRRR